MHHQNSLLGNMLEANQMHTSLAFKFLMSRRQLHSIYNYGCFYIAEEESMRNQKFSDICNSER